MADEAANKASDATPKEAMLIYHILNNVKSKLEIDWDAVAEVAGLLNANVARTRYHQIKKKLASKNEVDKLAAPKSSTPKKKSGSGTSLTPSKVAKKTPIAQKKNIVIIDDDDESKPVISDGLAVGYLAGKDEDESKSVTKDDHLLGYIESNAEVKANSSVKNELVTGYKQPHVESCDEDDL